MRAFRHLAIAFDLFLPTHIARLEVIDTFPVSHTPGYRMFKQASTTTDPGNPPPFRIPIIFMSQHCRLIRKHRRGHDRRNGRRIVLRVRGEKVGILVHEHLHVEAHAGGRIAKAIHDWIIWGFGSSSDVGVFTFTADNRRG